VIDGRYFLGYPVTLGFGEVVPETAAYGPHTGLDVGTPLNTPLPALLTGRVVDVRRERLGGLQVKVQDSSGATALFAHLAEADVIAGEPVTHDTIIGLSGMSGEAVTGPHVHIETRSPSGQLVDPVAFFGASSSAAQDRDCPAGWSKDSWGTCVPFAPGKAPTGPLDAPLKGAADAIGGGVAGIAGGIAGGIASTAAIVAVVLVLVVIGGRRVIGN